MLEANQSLQLSTTADEDFDEEEKGGVRREETDRKSGSNFVEEQLSCWL